MGLHETAACSSATGATGRAAVRGVFRPLRSISASVAVIVAMSTAVLLPGCSTGQATPLTDEEKCCKRKARHQAEFARSLGMSPPSPGL